MTTRPPGHSITPLLVHSTLRPVSRSLKVEIHGARDQAERQMLAHLLRRVARAEGCRARRLSLVLVSNPEIRALNRRFLHHNRFTDVIAFPISPEFLGEIYVSRDQARIQALAYGVTRREELLRLTLHGFLHLVGYPHRRMPARERRYLAPGSAGS